jgi:hypothetical protein
MDLDKGVVEETLVDLHCETASELALAMEREKLRSLRLENDRLESMWWKDGLVAVRNIVIIFAVAIIGLVFYACLPFCMYVLLQILDHAIPSIAITAAARLNYTVTYDAGKILNPFHLLYDSIGCSYINAAFKHRGEGVIGSSWFYLFNHTVNKSNCFF